MCYNCINYSSRYRHNILLSPALAYDTATLLWKSNLLHFPWIYSFLCPCMFLLHFVSKSSSFMHGERKIWAKVGKNSRKKYNGEKKKGMAFIFTHDLATLFFSPSIFTQGSRVFSLLISFNIKHAMAQALE